MAQQENITRLAAVEKKPDVSFYIAWVLLTCLCIPVAFFIDLMILRVVISFVGDYIYVNGVKHITEDYLAIQTLVPVVGLLTGAVQFALLRRFLPRMGWWIPATLGGWILGLLLAALAIRLGWLDPLNMRLILILMGASIGFGQWLVLRAHLRTAGWWIAANLLGWGMLALVTPGNFLDQYGLLLIGLFPAIVTAGVLALLMKQGPQGN